MLHTDMTRTGWFASSHEMLDRLHENVVWGMRGNFLSIPTDCPQRDERLGLDRRHPGLLADRELPVRLRRVPHVVAARPRPRAGAQATATSRSSCRPRCPRSAAPGPTPRGGMPRPSCRPCSTSASATAACSRRSTRACATGSTSCCRRPATAACGRGGCSSATGSTPPRRPTSPGRPRSTATSSRPPTSPARCGWWRSGRAARTRRGCRHLRALWPSAVVRPSSRST